MNRYLSLFRKASSGFGALCFMVVCLMGPAGVHAKPLRIGVIASVANVAIEQAIAEARAQGIDVKLVEFNDWVMPNTALADGSIDANFFQHEPFLQAFNQKRGTNLVPIAYGYSTTIGLFSKKLKRGDTIPDNATIAIPNDPVNMSRALLLLESMGLIRLTPEIAHKASVGDILSNPKGLKLIPMEGAQSARSFDDVTASVTYTTFAKYAGLNVNDGLAFDNQTPESIRRYAIRWVTTPERVNDSKLLMFIRIYQESVWVKSLLRAQYGELIDFPW